MKIYPDGWVYDAWTRCCLPNRDVFFISKNVYDEKRFEFKDVLVYTKKAYFTHSEYSRMVYTNYYGYWQLKPKYDYVVVAPSGWYEGLDEDLRNVLLREQSAVQSLAFESGALVTNHAFLNMSESEQSAYYRRQVDRFDEHEAVPIPNELQDRFKKVANTYVTVQGTNCFGVTLYALTGDEWMLSEWVFVDNLVHVMETRGYDEVDRHPVDGDVLVWYEAETPIHSAACVGDYLYLNKNNQTIWSPIKLVTLEILEREFAGLSYKVFGKGVD